MKPIGVGMLAAAVILSVLPPSAAISEEYEWALNNQKACPPGHRVPISIADVTLHVDLRSITLLSLGDFPVPPDGCPSQTVKADMLYLYMQDKWLMQLYEERDLAISLLMLQRGAAGNIWRRPGPIPDFTKQKRAIGTSGFVEDVTDRAHLPGAHLPSRQTAYVFQHLTDGMDNAPFLMICSGDPAGDLPRRRDCDAQYFIAPDLLLTYEVRQDNLDEDEKHWTKPSSKPIQEPDGLLEFDRKVRDLIQYFKTQP